VPDGDKQVCFVARGPQPERREVEIGEFNDEFIQLKTGLKEGERVFLRPPDGFEGEKPSENHKAPEKQQKSPVLPAATPGALPTQAKT